MAPFLWFQPNPTDSADWSRHLFLTFNYGWDSLRLDVGPAQESAIAKRLSDMPETCRRTYLRAMQGRSLSAAVKAFCMECVSWDRQEVARCTAPACPLYPYRPFGREKGRGTEGEDPTAS